MVAARSIGQCSFVGAANGYGVNLEATLHSQEWQRGESGTMLHGGSTGSPGAEVVLDRERDRDGQTKHVGAESTRGAVV